MKMFMFPGKASQCSLSDIGLVRGATSGSDTPQRNDGCIRCMISYESEATSYPYSQCLAPLVLPNVVPEGVEQAIRRTGVRMPEKVIGTTR